MLGVGVRYSVKCLGWEAEEANQNEASDCTGCGVRLGKLRHQTAQAAADPQCLCTCLKAGGLTVHLKAPHED